MLASIHPLGERARHNRFWITATAYIAGSVAGGASAGWIAGAIGAALWAIASPTSGGGLAGGIRLPLGGAADASGAFPG